MTSHHRTCTQTKVFFNTSHQQILFLLCIMIKFLTLIFAFLLPEFKQRRVLSAKEPGRLRPCQDGKQEEPTSKN